MSRYLEMPPGYDAWKTRSPYDDWDEQPEPDFECEECQDTGWQLVDGRAEPCRICQDMPTLDDLEELAAEEAP